MSKKHDCKPPRWPNGRPLGFYGSKWKCSWCWDTWKVKRSGYVNRWTGLEVNEWKRIKRYKGAIKPDPTPLPYR